MSARELSTRAPTSSPPHIEDHILLPRLNRALDLGQNDRQIGSLVSARGIDDPDAVALHLVARLAAAEVGIDDVEIGNGHVMIAGKMDR